MFRNNRTEVALIHKKHPAWQAGYLNGIGGKIESGEPPFEAMCREFWEEAGCSTFEWLRFARTSWEEGFVDYFVCESDGAEISTQTDEEVDWIAVSDLPKLKVIPNLTWVIPMALLRFHERFIANINYTNDPLQKEIQKFKT